MDWPKGSAISATVWVRAHSPSRLATTTRPREQRTRRVYELAKHASDGPAVYRGSVARFSEKEPYPSDLMQRYVARFSQSAQSSKTISTTQIA